MMLGNYSTQENYLESAALPTGPELFQQAVPLVKWNFLLSDHCILLYRCFTIDNQLNLLSSEIHRDVC